MTSNVYQDMRFLIVDHLKPSQDILKQFAMRLSTKQVDSSHYAQDVVSICQQKDYDVILLGYDLGDNQKNGQQILEELRINNHISRHCIVILITAEVSQAMVLAALEHKPDDYLCKPYTLHDLDKRLTKCLRKKVAMAPIYQALDLGDANLVIEFCDQAIHEKTPYKTECLGIKSRQFYELALFEQAQDIYDNYKDTANCQWAYIGLGKIALHKEELERAEQIFRALIEKHPLYLASYDWLTTTYQKQFNFLFAEEVLEQALKLSPRSIPRLKQYAKQCLDNKHFEKATFAYEQTYKLAHNSIHHAPENAIMFAKALIEYSPTIPLVDARKMNNRAYQYLHQMNRDFRGSDLRIQSHLLTASLLQATNDDRMAKDEIALGEKILSKEIASLESSFLREIAGTLTQLNRGSSASQVLIRAEECEKQDCEENPTENSKELIRKKAQASLAKGQELYHNKEYAKAIKHLNEARTLFPQHSGIKLNLIQALLVSYETNTQNTPHFKCAKKIINELNIDTMTFEEQQRFKRVESMYKQLCEEL